MEVHAVHKSGSCLFSEWKYSKNVSSKYSQTNLSSVEYKTEIKSSNEEKNEEYFCLQ